MAIVSPGRSEIAAIIPTNNRCDRLMQTLSQLEQTPFEWEAVVADNGSDDDTVFSVKKNHPNTTVLELKKNMGSAARNIAAENAKAAHLMMLDDDSYPLPGAVEELLGALRRNGRLGIAACMVRLTESDGPFEEGGSIHVHVGCGAALRKNEFFAMGGYDEEYGTYVEEYGLAYLYLAEGFDVRYLPRAEVVHVRGERPKDFLIEKLVANNAYLAARFYPPKARDAHIAWIKFRYRVIAEASGAMEGYKRGLDAIPEKTKRGNERRVELPASALNKILPRRLARPALHKAKADGATGVGFVYAGKEITGLIEAAADVGLPVRGVYDNWTGKVHDAWRFGLPIKPLLSLTAKEGDRLFLGGLSPGFTANRLKECQKLGVRPVVHGFLRPA